MSKEKESKRKSLAAYQSTLVAIREAAARVNDAASAASDEIDLLERALAEIEPGVTVWTDPVFQGASTFVHDDAAVENATRIVKLGFGKLQKWGFLVSETFVSPNGSQLACEVQLLRKAERELRLMALPHLSHVLEGVLAALNAGVAKLPAAPVDSDFAAVTD